MTTKQKTTLMALRKILSEGVKIIDSIIGDSLEDNMNDENSLLGKETNTINLDEILELIVTQELKKIGIHASIKGYEVLRSAMIISVKSGTIKQDVTHNIYPNLAKEYNVSTAAIERRIRHAIEVAWTKGNIEYLEELFGYSVSSEKGKTTNGEFLAMMTDVILKKLKNEI